MKYLLILNFLLAGCNSDAPTPKFKVGDCIRHFKEDRESWHKDIGDIQVIREIGKKSYRVEFFDVDSWIPFIDLNFWEQDLYEVTLCPEEKKR